MTCKEKLHEEHPDLIEWAQEFFGSNVNYFGCPRMFGYQIEPSNCDQRKCAACWDRELEIVKE